MCDHFGLSALVGMHYGFLAVRMMLVFSAYFAARQLRSLWSPTYALAHGEPSGESVASKLVHYYSSRVVRLGLVAYTAIFLAVAFNADAARQTWTWHASFATNLWIMKNTDWPGCLSHFWSLAVQMQFLLILPPVILILARRKIRFVLFAGVLAAVAHRACVVFGGAEDFLRWMPIINSLDSFCMGVGLAWVEQERPHWFTKLRTVLVSTLAIACLASVHWLRGAAYDKPWGILTETGESLAMAILFGALLAGRSFGPVGAFLRSTPMVKLGAASLSLYALHPVVERILAYFLIGANAPHNPAHSGLWFQFAAAGASLLTAWVGFHLIEIPARKISSLIETGANYVIPRLFALRSMNFSWMRNMQPLGTAFLCMILVYSATATLRRPPPSLDQIPPKQTIATDDISVEPDNFIPFFLDSADKAENIV